MKSYFTMTAPGIPCHQRLACLPKYKYTKNPLRGLRLLFKFNFLSQIPDHLRMPQGGPRPASYSLDSDDEAGGSSRPQGFQSHGGARADSRLSSNSSSVDCITLDTSEDEDEGGEPQAKRSRVGGDGSPLTVSSTSSPSVFPPPGSPDCITIDDD